MPGWVGTSPTVNPNENDPLGPYLIVIGAVFASATLGAMVQSWQGWARGTVFGVSVVLLVWGIARTELRARGRRLQQTAERLEREQALLEIERAQIAAERAELQPEQ